MTTLFENLLVAVDESAPADAAADLAIRIASANGGHVTFCHVTDFARLFAAADSATAPPVDVVEIARHGCRNLLARLRARAQKAGVAASTMHREGHPVEGVLQAAQDHGADVIVIGTHGRNGLGRLFLGSTAEGVLRRAEVPVIATRC